MPWTPTRTVTGWPVSRSDPSQRLWSVGAVRVRNRSRYTVSLRKDVFGRAAELAGFRSDYALARAMGVNRSTVARVRSGVLRPGARFISGALTALEPMEFEDLFEVKEK